MREKQLRLLHIWRLDLAIQPSITENPKEPLLEFLHLFLIEYNDRPHQGLRSPGLSPNEFAKRLWLV